MAKVATLQNPTKISWLTTHVIVFFLDESSDQDDKNSAAYG